MLVNEGPVTFLLQNRVHRWADSGGVLNKSHFIDPEAVSIVLSGPYHQTSVDIGKNQSLCRQLTERHADGLPTFVNALYQIVT